MMLTPNTTYSDNTQYVGVYFRIVTGKYDSRISWPYQLKTVLTLISQNQDDGNEFEKDIPFTVTPNTDPCRLRSAFLRPSTDNDYRIKPDGCGNRRHLSLESLLSSAMNRYFNNNGSLLIRLTVFKQEHGQAQEKAVLSMKHNSLVSEFIWSIYNFSEIQSESIEKESVVVLSSDPFYTSPGGYLIQLFLTLLPKKKAFALSMAFTQGDYDRFA